MTLISILYLLLKNLYYLIVYKLLGNCHTFYKYRYKQKEYQKECRYK